MKILNSRLIDKEQPLSVKDFESFKPLFDEKKIR